MNKKQINEQLRSSLELKVTWQRMLLVALVVVPVILFAGLTWDGPLDARFWYATAVGCGLTLVPLLIFCIVRTLQIFRKSEHYIFCRTKLATPHGGPLRDTIFFTVVLEDPEDSGKFFVDTHSIFYTHGTIGPGLEAYINATVTIAYNRETGMVVVIG